MKTLQTSAVALMLGLVVSTSLQAQHNTMQIAQNQPVNSSNAYYIEAPQKADRKTFDISLYRVQQSMTVCLSISKDAGQKVVVRLLNNNGEELYAESIGSRTDKYSRRFDFGDVTDGAYTIEVSNGQEVIRKSLNLSTTKPVESPDRTIIALN